ncbi:MAG: C25 family cysteine peptidase [Ignavibacteriales bacterium]|nr:C25 family cysteine peptidase [Ignavibacteriales bacterium]
MANYYGHGGGGQWHLIFTNDDILELNNGNKLPVILSVTCLHAQFDNQDCFGEIFVKTPGKGAIGFLGSTGLTYWEPGTIMNRRIYDQIFSNKNYVIGKAILKCKIQCWRIY